MQVWQEIPELSDKKTHQLNIRLNHENFILLNQMSKDTKQGPSTIGSQIVSQWIEFYCYKIHKGDVIFSKQILKKIIGILDKSKIDKVSEFMARHIIKEIKLQEGDVTYPVLSDHILKWNKVNRLQLNRIRQNNNNDDETNTGEKIFSRTFTLDGIPATLPYAWITRIFDICSQIQMWYNPLDKDEAITRMVRFKNIIYDDAKSNRVTSELFKRADDAENSLRKDTTRLYEVIVNCTVVGQDRKSLKENCKTFKKHLKRYGGHFSAVSAKQASMLYEGFGKKITFDRGSCAILIPLLLNSFSMRDRRAPYTMIRPSSSP